MDYIELKLKMKDKKSEMTSSERIEKYFAGEEVDHIPYSLFLENETLCEIYGYKTSEMNADFNIYAEIIDRAREDFGMDKVNIGLGLKILGAAMGSTHICPDNGYIQIEEYILQDYDDWDKMVDIDPYNNKILTPMLEKAAKVEREISRYSIKYKYYRPNI